MSTKESLTTQNFTCVAATTAILGDKWTPLIINALYLEPLRFCHLQDTIGGVNPRTLSARLTSLEEHDIVQKQPQESSPYPCYQLTNKGKDLFPIINSMTQWGEKYTHATPSH